MGIIALGGLGILASVLNLWPLAMIIFYASMVVLSLLILICMRRVLEKSQVENFGLREDLQDLIESVSSLDSQVQPSITKIIEADAEDRRLVKTRHEEVIAMRDRLGSLENELSVNRTALNAFKKEIMNGVRDSERRLAKGAPKAVEVRRAHERVEAAERRILGTLETQSYDQGINQSEQSKLIADLADRLERFSDFAELPASRQSLAPHRKSREADNHYAHNMVSKISSHVTKTARDSIRQLESLMHLSPYFTDKKLPMPSTGGFALDAQALAHLVSLVEERRPQRILELGSGTSSIWLGYLCRSFGGRLVTIDHLEEYLELTRGALTRHHLNDQVETRLAPLEAVQCQGTNYNWYAVEALEGLSDIDMVLVDGPPAATGEMARYPALPLIMDRLAPNATVILDDAHRKDEGDILATWRRAHPDFIHIEAGASRLGILERRL